jgi:hypothetical protein
MTATKLLDFAEEHARATNDKLSELEESLILVKIKLSIKLEQDPSDTTLPRQINEILEKLRMIRFMKAQRLELFYQSGL